MMIGGAALAALAGGGYLGVRRMGSRSDYAAYNARLRAPLAAAPDIQDLLRYATLAANGHNTQPWKFQVAGRQISMLPDFARRTPVVDPDDHHLYASLGCASENLAIAAAARGRPGALAFDTAGAGAARFEYVDGASAVSPLFDAIPRRQSTRANYDGRGVGAGDLQALRTAAAMDGVDLVLVTDRPMMGRIRDLVVAGNSAQLADPAFVRELRDWIRFNPRDAMTTGDGLYSATSGNPALPAWLGARMFDLTFKEKSENDRYVGHIDSSAGIAVFLAARADPQHWFLAGRAGQRFALQATALGLKTAFINQPVEVAPLRPELSSLLGMPGRRPDLVLRFGYGPTLPFSPRRAPNLVG